MDNINNIIKEIDELLSMEVPVKYISHVIKLRSLIAQDLLRAAYA